ncbi:MAG: hypothetical protein ABR514_01380 [Chthoniobacterales bacterium]
MAVVRKHWRKIVVAAALLVVVVMTPVIILFVLEVHWFHQWNAKRLPFEQTAWKANLDPGEMDPVRLRMVDDLLAHHNFIGVSRAAIDDLLGSSKPTNKFGDWDLIYWLGPERGSVRIDSEWLVFELDKENRVTAYRLVQD